MLFLQTRTPRAVSAPPRPPVVKKERPPKERPAKEAKVQEHKKVGDEFLFLRVLIAP